MGQAEEGAAAVGNSGGGGAAIGEGRGGGALPLTRLSLFIYLIKYFHRLLLLIYIYILKYTIFLI